MSVVVFRGLECFKLGLYRNTALCFMVVFQRLRFLTVSCTGDQIGPHTHTHTREKDNRLVSMRCEKKKPDFALRLLPNWYIFGRRFFFSVSFSFNSATTLLMCLDFIFIFFNAFLIALPQVHFTTMFASQVDRNMSPPGPHSYINEVEDMTKASALNLYIVCSSLRSRCTV